jgi:hypothetical protein
MVGMSVDLTRSKEDARIKQQEFYEQTEQFWLLKKAHAPCETKLNGLYTLARCTYFATHYVYTHARF